MAEPASSDVLLECRNLSAGYGPITVIRDVDLQVRSGEVVALIGPNGAGKTTTLFALAGELPAASGEVHMLGRLTKDPMHVRCQKGLGFVTEERSVIMNLSVAENLRIASVQVDEATELFPPLAALMKRKAGLLSGGEQQMLTLARAVCRAPKVLLIDELSLGLAPIVVANLLDTVRRLATERGIGVLLVEQHVRQALQVADRVAVMQRGRIVMSDSATEIASRLGEIEAAYLTSASPAAEASDG